MSDKPQTRMEKIKSGVFSHNDVVSISANFEKAGSNAYRENISDLVEYVCLEEIENIVKTGMMWKFNPTCLKLFVNDSLFVYNKAALLKDISENCSWDSIELDRNTHVFSCQYDIEMLLINVLQINESIVENADYITIQNLVGEIEI